MKNSRSILLNKDETNIPLTIKGQGVFVFENTDNNQACYFKIFNQDKTDGLVVLFTPECVKVNRIGILMPCIDDNNVQGLIDITGAYYWFSLDSQNQTLYAGIGEARMETVIYKYKFVFTPERDDERVINKKFLESLVNIYVPPDVKIVPLKLIRDPITANIPLGVKRTDQITIDHIAQGLFLPKPNLSIIGQKLHDCIAGNAFVLDDADFPEFSQAIEYSIKNENGWCYKRLQEKSTEFNKDQPNPLETYLRITLGQNNGESPGIPYVLEIWPPGHYSPIHSHAGANAIIRVLHGSINVKLFPFLSGEEVPHFAESDFDKDDITWISPTLNQIHQLKNLEENTETCMTLQCYMYDEQSNTHYDYFDYADVSGNIQQYEPDSDMDFVEFKQLMKEEWANRPSKRDIWSFMYSFLI